MYHMLLIPSEVIRQRSQNSHPPLHHHVSLEPQTILDDLSLEILTEDRGERHVGRGEGEEGDQGPGARGGVVHLNYVSGRFIYQTSNCQQNIVFSMCVIGL